MHQVPFYQQRVTFVYVGWGRVCRHTCVHVHIRFSRGASTPWDLMIPHAHKLCLGSWWETCFQRHSHSAWRFPNPHRGAQVDARTRDVNSQTEAEYGIPGLQGLSYERSSRVRCWGVWAWEDCPGGCWNQREEDEKPSLGTFPLGRNSTKLPFWKMGCTGGLSSLWSHPVCSVWAVASAACTESSNMLSPGMLSAARFQAVLITVWERQPLLPRSWLGRGTDKKEFQVLSTLACHV